jgi:ribosomal protein S18 acetylase RimI-like enzyme
MLTRTNHQQGVNWTEMETLNRLAPLGNKSASHLELVFTNSRFKWFVHDDGQLVAAGRALADGADCSYICDIAVLPSYQGQGLGKELVSKLVADSKGHKKIILYSIPGKESFYAKFGFLPMKTAMAIFQDSRSAIARGFLATTDDTAGGREAF